MKHFIVEIVYHAPIEKIEEIKPRHRAFLKTGYEKGVILMSGPQVPRIGGLIVARSNSMEELAKFLSDDPYQTERVAHYQYIEFDPVNRQEFMNDWLEND